MLFGMTMRVFNEKLVWLWEFLS